MVVTFEQVLSFWFQELDNEARFTKNKDLDANIRERFLATWQAASQGELWAWRQTMSGRLAEIIVLDQFSRNIWRDDARSFSQDAMALVLCQELIAQADFEHMSATEKQFALLPMMHSESLVIQDASLSWFEEHCDAVILDFAQKHRDIVAKFGRFPHRNAVLGRVSTPEETAFLQQPGSSF